MTGGAGPLVYLIAGEASGDALGAGLMAALKERFQGDVRFAGVGGPQMEAEGLASLFPMDDLGVMGLAEILPRLFRLIGRMNQTKADIRSRKPHVLVTIDSKGFTLRVAEAIKKQAPDIPIVHLVAPTVWAYRPERASAVAGYLDHLLCLYPFEPPFFEREGLAATFIGHPIATQPPGNGAAFRARHGFGDDVPVLLVLPGSRSGELDRLLPVFAESLNRVFAAGWRGRVVIPTLPGLAPRLAAAVAGWPGDPLIVTDLAGKRDAFACARAALAASGTVVLELAVAGVPAVVAYRMAPLTAAIARRLIRVRHVGLINILLDDDVMPEFLQENCRADQIAPALTSLLTDDRAHAAQRSRFRDVMTMLTGPSGGPAAAAANVVAGIIRQA